jgi:hypothetical protein
MDIVKKRSFALMTHFSVCRTLLLAAVGTMLWPVSSSLGQAAEQKTAKSNWADRFLGLKRDKTGGWLFVGFRNNSEDGVYFAISKDGYHWSLVNDGKPILRQTEHGELMRDPFIQRGPDGNFRMAWTWSWGTPAILGYSTSTDLLHWTKQRPLPVTAAIPAAMNAWAPAMYYEPDKKCWLIFWSSTVPPAGKAGSPLDHRIYATTTTDFKQFTPARIFFDPGFNVIDATLLPVRDEAVSDKAGQYYLLFKDERTDPIEKHILAAKGPGMEGPWQEISAPLTETRSEGPAALAVPGGYLVYYDHYHDPQHYSAAFSTDLQHWADATAKISFPAGMRHGSFLHIETSEYNLLLDYHQGFDSGFTK